MRASLVSAIALLAAAIPAEQLTLDLRGDSLFASARKLDLMQPRLLGQLKRGGTVAFDFQLALWVGTRNTVSRRSFERFAVSYDLWEEKFAVASLRKPQARASGLANGAAIGAWCLQNVGLPAPKLGDAERLWVRLDVRAVENRHQADLSQEDGLDIGGLIEIFSRGVKSGESRWSLESGPVSVATLRAREAELRTP